MPILDERAGQLGISRIDLAETEAFSLGHMHVVPARREVRFDGKQRELEPQVMKVLVALASVRPDVLSRDRLVQQCWDGRIVGDDTLNRCILALRHLAKDTTPTPFAIETIRGVGYCLVEPTGSSEGAKPASPRRMPKVVLGAFVAVLLGAATVAAWSYFAEADDEPIAIAVLPFRSLSPGDPYFAEGVSEEILSQLGREVQFRVAGRSSASQFGPDPDIREVARRLDVDYVLEGSVRRQSNRVRISAALIRASDDTQLWSQTYEGDLDDVFNIQQRIGADIAGSLQRRLAVRPAPDDALVADPRAHDLYLAGKSLLRTRNVRVGGTAAGVLRDAIAIDPDYAPAWASLATAVQLDGASAGYEGLITARAQAQTYARRALQLAPNLPQAHRVLGEALPFGSPEFVFHLRRAAQLDPGDAENLIWLGVAESAEGNFDAELAAYRRAFAIDPLWFRTTGQLAIGLAERGRRQEAESVARKGMASDVWNRHILLGRIAWILGDSSEAARQWSIVSEGNSPRWSGTAKRNLDDVLFGLGLRDTQGALVPRAQDMRHRGQVWMDRAPDRATWLARNRDAIKADIYRAENCVAAKLMLTEGRTRELMQAYDGPIGLLSMKAGQRVRPDQLREVPVVVLALRQAGREAEAGGLLRSARAIIRSIDDRGDAPFWFDAEVAGVFAVSGHAERALTRLEDAMARGWSHSDAADLREIGAEPAFATLRNNPRFERIRAGLNARLLQEQTQTRQLRL